MHGEENAVIRIELLSCRSGGMVDATVSKTFGLGPCGFDSHLRHHMIRF